MEEPVTRIRCPSIESYYKRDDYKGDERPFMPARLKAFQIVPAPVAGPFLLTIETGPSPLSPPAPSDRS